MLSVCATVRNRRMYVSLSIIEAVGVHPAEVMHSLNKARSHPRMLKLVQCPVCLANPKMLPEAVCCVTVAARGAGTNSSLLLETRRGLQ